MQPRQVYPPRKLCAILIGIFVFNFSFSQAQINLGSLSKNGNPVKYIAVGSSLTAGVRDGGVYADAQRTCFPSLLAQQMNITGFKQPLLEGSGTGKRFISTNGDLAVGVIKEVGLYNESNESIQLPKVSNKVENMAVPFQKMTYVTTKEREPGVFTEGIEKRSYNHSNRFLSNENEGLSYLEVLNKEVDQIDFFTHELGIDDFTSYYNSGGYRQDISALTNTRESFYPEERIMSFLKSKNAKGVIINIPEILSLPYYNYISYEEIVNNLKQAPFIERFGKNHVRQAIKGDYFLPTEQLLQTLSGNSGIGLSADNPFLDEEIIGVEEVVSQKLYNSYLESLASRYQLPLFDLNQLYSRIISNKYETKNGVKITSKTFFSADGLNPSALGHLIITNELILTINKFYGSQIPPIQINK